MNATSAPKPSADFMAARLFLNVCRQEVGTHLAARHRLFQKFPGVRLAVMWAPARLKRWGAANLPASSDLCRNIANRGPEDRAGCVGCGLLHLDLTLKTGRVGHPFTCPRGVRNYWLPIFFGGSPVAIAFVQALERNNRQPRLTASPFNQAVELLRLIVENAKNSALAALRKNDLARAQRALRVCESVECRLRLKLQRVHLHEPAPAPQRESHPVQMVHCLLDLIHRDFARPLTLKQCSSNLGVNNAYLSDLFSRTVGLTFKAYLTEVRLEKARELLSDPIHSIADVAFAVGYSSRNRFRLAFKQANGVSPRLWRETLRVKPGVPALGT